MWHVGREFASSIYRYPAESSYLEFMLRTIGGSWAAVYLAAPLGIRTLHPFLDVDLVSYCLQLPRDLRRLPEGENKSLCRPPCAASSQKRYEQEGPRPLATCSTCSGSTRTGSIWKP